MAARRRSTRAKAGEDRESREGVAAEPLAAYRVSELVAIDGGTAEDPRTFYTLALTDVDGDKDAQGRLTFIAGADGADVAQGAIVGLVVLTPAPDPPPEPEPDPPAAEDQ